MMAEATRFPIELDNVGYRIGEARLVAALSLAVAEGETLVLLGRSGSGKTTALRLVNRLLRATEGRVLVEGVAVEDWDPIRLRRRIANLMLSC